MRDEVVGTLRWAIKNHERTLDGAYETFKLTSDANLFQSTVSSICGKILDKTMSDRYSKEQVARFKEKKKQRDSSILKLIEEFRKSGNLMEFVSDLGPIITQETPKAAKIPEPPVKKQKPEKPAEIIKQQPMEIQDYTYNPQEEQKDQTPEDSNEEETDVAADIINSLETERKISKDDTMALMEMYNKGSKEIFDAIQEFKRDHDFESLGNKLIPLLRPSKKADKKKSKKKKYKTFAECIEFFKVNL
jgi:hypothetical protein